MKTKRMQVVRGDGMEVVVFPGQDGWEVAAVADAEVRRWQREVGAIPVSATVVYDYRLGAAVPVCQQCERYDVCRDMAADDHDDQEIDEVLEAARKQECWAFDFGKMLGDINNLPDDEEAVREWAEGA